MLLTQRIFFFLLFLFTVIDTYGRLSTKIPVSSSEIYSPSVFVTINCLNKGCKRANHSYYDWGKEFMQKYKNVSVKIVSTYEGDTEKNITLFSRNIYNEKPFRQTFYNSYVAYHYFLTKTDKKWMFRTTEDVFVDIDNFVNLLRKIETEHANDTVFIGQIILNKFYAHGGVGWIMNREGTKVWMRNKKHFDYYFRMHSNVGDDVIIDEYQRVSKIPGEKMHTNLFYGFPISGETEEKLIARKWDSFGKCPPQNNSKYEDKARVNDVAVWHSGSKSNYPALHGREIIKEAPKDLYMMHYLTETILCYP